MDFKEALAQAKTVEEIRAVYDRYILNPTKEEFCAALISVMENDLKIRNQK